VKQRLRAVISIASGGVVAAVAAVTTLASTSGVGGFVGDAFLLPGGEVLSWSHHSAPQVFKQLTASDGPGAAFLWMLSVSVSFWTVVIALIVFACLRFIRPQTI